MNTKHMFNVMEPSLAYLLPTMTIVIVLLAPWISISNCLALELLICPLSFGTGLALPVEKNKASHVDDLL
jgi:hypothetical protein